MPSVIAVPFPHALASCPDRAPTQPPLRGQHDPHPLRHRPARWGNPCLSVAGRASARGQVSALDAPIKPWHSGKWEATQACAVICAPGRAAAIVPADGAAGRGKRTAPPFAGQRRRTSAVRAGPEGDADGTHRRAAGQRAALQGLASGNHPADAGEQPGERREARGPGDLHRGAGGTRLGRLPPDRRDPEGPGGRRDHAGPVGQADRQAEDPRARAPRHHGQRQRAGPLGRRRGFLRAGEEGPDLRPGHDRRRLAVHRQPGHPAGHLPELRQRRAAVFRRHAGPPHDPDRRVRRHGRRPAAGRQDGRCRNPGGRGRPRPHPAPHRRRLLRPHDHRYRRGPGLDRGGARRRRRCLGRPGRQRRDGLPAAPGQGLPARHHDRPGHGRPAPRLYPGRHDRRRGSRAVEDRPG